MSQSKIKKNINVLSLFSGCGGMDLGFEGGFTTHHKSIYNKEYIDRAIDKKTIKLKSTRFKTVFANDILNEAYKTWVHNFAKYGYSSDIFHKESIVDIIKKYKTGEFVFPQNIDLVIGGFPCQDFSVAGKRLGFESTKDHTGKIADGNLSAEESRGKLYSWMKEVINITKPKIFLAENVKGLVNLNDVKDIIQQDFASASNNGYIVLSPKVLHAANYGVPQSRERVFFIGIRKDALNKKALEILSSETIPNEYNPYPSPTHCLNNEDNLLKPAVVLKDVFSMLQEPDITDDASQKTYSKAKYMGAHCQGQKEISLDKIGPTIRSEHHGNIEYRRLSAANGGCNLKELNKGLIERRLTPRECATIQTFPLDFEFVINNNERGSKYKVSPSAAYKVIGNAVPPVLAYHIAKRLESIWTLYFDELC